MSVLIQNYRGVDILFDADNERFSYKFDLGNWTQKQSFASCKKSIDDFLKANATFEPFVVREIRSGKCLKIVGIRKDNRFVYEKGNDRGQLSEYEERCYIEYDEAHENKYATVAILELEIDKLNDKISDVIKTIIGKNLKDLKSNYLLPV